MKKAIEVFNEYNAALEKGDIGKALSFFSPSIIWHQPGKNKLSGKIVGSENVAAHLGKFAEDTNGTFKIETKWASENNDYVSANVLFQANKKDSVLNLEGTDVFRIENDLIQEVWLFTIDQEKEDEFWDL